MDPGGECQNFGLRRTSLLAFSANIDLNADIQWRERVRSLGIEAFGDLQTVNAVHPVEVFGHGAALVGLQGADKVLFDIVQTDFPGGLDLVDCLLDIGFTEASLTSVIDGLHGGKGFGFVDGEQLHTVGGTARRHGGLRNTVLYLLQLQRYIAHVVTVTRI